jgi:sulfite exporter TauE/SafE
MIGMLAAVCASSAAGSVHCAAMCGPLVGLWNDPSSRVAPHLAHAVGRATAYVTLGAIAGALGGALDLAGGMLHVQRVAWLCAAAIVTSWGVITLLGALGVVPRRVRGGGAFGRGLVRIRRAKPVPRAALVGVLSAALPCGWLWAFVVLAAGAGGALAGAAIMLAFWLGTVPMMLGAGVAIGPIARRLGARFPLVSASILIALGAYALVVRAPLAAQAAPASSSAHVIPSDHMCHGH